ncbi:MAG TPA: hypothetical protein VHI14_09375 [Jatrophihabitantaceae bacterium]|jgi:hypothetical protein|nr:hypothetical protein [Jatrophihabitantaceae bacterium]
MTKRVTTRRTVAALAAVFTAAALIAAMSSPAGASGGDFVTQNQVVSAVPAAWTPQVKDGAVWAIQQVGSTMVVGGQFTQVSPSGGSPVYARTNIFSFNATTGAINTGFNPSVNGTVQQILPGPTATTAYIAGSFGTVNGVTAKVALIDVTTGAIVSSFHAPGINGAVLDIEKYGNRLFLAGNFTVVGGVAHGGLATLNATTGALDPFMNLTVSEHHNYNGTGAQGVVGVRRMDISPNGQYLVAIGNFKKVNGIARDQAVMIDITGASAVVRADWATHRYEPRCSAGSFDYYVRDVDFAPDGTYFVIVATGGPWPGTLCDTAARWTTTASGSDIQPVWIADTGGDTLWSAEVTGTAVYVGGHQRWLNNAGGHDSPAPGSVPRPGLASLDPRSGVPFSWNPGRNPRGAGAYVLTATAAGLWVGMDTNYIGNFLYWRPKLAFFPLSGGTTVGPGVSPQLPTNVYQGGNVTGVADINALTRRFYDGATAGAQQTAPSGGIAWNNVRAATVVDGVLYYATSDSILHRRTFDGTTYGTDQVVDPYNDPVWSNVSTGSGQTYRGVKPDYYTAIPNLAGMAYLDGKLYTTRTTLASIESRSFSPESGIISGQHGTVPGTFTNIGGIFFSGGQLYFTNRVTGTLSRVAWVNGAPSGSPVVVSGPLVDGVDWKARAVFTGA